MNWQSLSSSWSCGGAGGDGVGREMVVVVWWLCLWRCCLVVHVCI